jgi:hypothetical protein
LTLRSSFEDLPVVDAPKKVQPNQFKRVVVALIQLTLTVAMLILLIIGEKAVHHHGRADWALVAGVILGAAVMWFSMLRAIKRPSKA